jgi:YegS/Rv2252/BmrU family lipid kinase
MVLHAEHDGQRPTHLGLVSPHWLHRNRTLDLATPAMLGTGCDSAGDPEHGATGTVYRPAMTPTPAPGHHAEAGWFVIANGNAGSAERTAVDAALATLAERAPARLVHTTHPDELDDALASAAGHTLVVVGGDGSLHLVVARLRERGVLADTVLGLVPLGTGNDFARGVGIPLDPAEASRRLVEGRARPMDLLVDDAGGVVVNAVHAGIGAEAAERAEGLKEHLGPLAYPMATVLAGVRVEGWDLEVSVDGERLTVPGDRVLLVGVGNGPSIGGGTHLCPGAVPDDGLLDVVVAAAVGPADRAAFGAALRQGSHLERDDVVSARGRSVRICGEAVGHDADGEVTHEVTDRTYTIDHAAWTLIT